MKFITVDKLKELINSNKIRLKDKEYFDELYHYHNDHLHIKAKDRVG